MTEKVNWDKTDVQIQRQGRHITLPLEPGPMPTGKAIEALVRLQKDEEQQFEVMETFDAFPHDAAVAFVKAMRSLYGWASPQTVMTMFGPKPPAMLTIKVGPKAEDVMQCPMGQFALPNVELPINSLIHGSLGFIVHGKVRKKDQATVLEICTLTRKILKEESIYRGKPLSFKVDEAGEVDMNTPPEFMDVSDMTEESLIYDDDVKAQIVTSILTPIRQTDLCRKHKIPLKRGILLEGPYGTGKSLTARLTARVCEENGWTFVLLDKVHGLTGALEFANRYAPAVIFSEDIDRVLEERDDAANDLLNTIDGIVSKKAEIMVVLTTNFVEKLDKAMLRPGRLDAIISIRAPGPAAVEKLVRLYGGKLLDATEDLASVGEELKGQIPASIREAVERAKLGMIGRQDTKLSASDLVVASRTMKNHLTLLNGKPPEEHTDGEKLAYVLRAILGLNGRGMEKIVQEELAPIHNKVREIHDSVT